MSVTLDLTTLSLPVVTFAASVSCLLVDGNEAWFMANVTSTSHPDIIAMGSEHVGYVRDIGGSGTDIMHAEAAADVSNTPLTCADRPVLAQTVVQSGDYTIR